MMKPIDNCVYVLICVLSDVGCFDQDKTIKAGKIMLDRWNMPEDWTLDRWIGRCIDRRLRAMDSGIGLRRAKITPRISELRSQLVDWVISHKRGRCIEESDEASWTNDMLDNMIHA